MSEPARVTPERVLDLLHAFERTSVLAAGLEMDLFTAIGGASLTLEEIAERTGGTHRGLRALLDYLVTLGLLARGSGGYSLTAESRRYLDRASPEYLGGMARFLASSTMREAYAHAAATIRGGGPPPPSADTTRALHPIWVEYARGMAPVFRGPSDAVGRLVAERHPGVRTVLDIAAGHGMFGIALARRFPKATVTALDAAEVLQVARENASSAGLADRFRWIAGDAFSAPLGSDYDVVVLANFVHHFGSADIAALLGRVHAALAPGGLVVLVEFVPDEPRLAPAAAVQFGMTMVATTPAGDVYTFSELAELLRRAGFEGPEIAPLPHTPQEAVLARRGGASPPAPL